jgi:glutamate dehydrogenase
LLPEVCTLFRGVERAALEAHTASLVAGGVPGDLATWATRIAYSFGLLDIVEVTRAAGLDPADAVIEDVAGVYFVLSERFRVDAVLSRISDLPREDRWQTLARMALRYDLYAALAALSSEVLASTSPGADPEARVFEWEQINASSIARARNAMSDFDGSRADLAALSVLLRQIRTLVRTTAA